MKDEGVPQPFLVAFPEEGGGQRVMLDPGFFHGLDEVGLFMADLVRHYARAFVQSGRARDMADAIEQVREMFDMELASSADEGTDGRLS